MVNDLQGKFPTPRNRELIRQYQGFKSAHQGSFSPDQGTPRLTPPAAGRGTPRLALPVHELRPARRKLDHPTHAALARADVIVADDKTLALQLGGRIRVVDRHLVGRLDVDARDAGPPRRAGAGKALVGRDDCLALRIMSGND